MKNAFKTLTFFLGLLLCSGALVGSAQAAGTTPVATSTPGTGTATITWTGVTNATNYQVQVLIGKVPIKTSASLAANARSYTFTGLEYNVPLKLQVMSKNGSWSSWVRASPDPITPVAAAPSAPDQPIVSVIEDKRIKVEWALPSSDGGSPISSYSVQLLKEGVAAGEPVTTTSLQLEMGTADTTSSYSVTVAAVNTASLKSSASEASTPVSAKKKAVAVVDLSSGNTPSSGGNSGNTPASGGNSSNAPQVDQLKQVVSPAPVVPAYTKVITSKSKVTSKTMVSLSKLSVPKNSKTTFKLSSSSKKYCQLSGTTIKNIKAGTCLVTVTVTTKAGAKKSRTVKLIAR